MSHPTTAVKLHLYKHNRCQPRPPPVQQYPIDMEDNDYEGASESESESDFSDSFEDGFEGSPSLRFRTGSWRRAVRGRPSLGLRSRAGICYSEQNLSTLHSISDISSSPFETTNDTYDTTSEKENISTGVRDTEEIYASICKIRPRPTIPPPPLPTSRIQGLSMIQELSPVMPDDCDDLPIVPPPLNLVRDWRPQSTSTTVSLHQAMPPALPPRVRTNPRHAPTRHLSTTPRTSMRRNLPMVKYSQIIDGFERPSSYHRPTYSPDYQPPRAASYYRSENFGMPNLLSKTLGSQGIIYLTQTITHSANKCTLSVYVEKAVYFKDPSIQSPISSYVKLEIRDRPSSRKRHSSHRSRMERERPKESHRTQLLSSTLEPRFDENFDFQIDRENSKSNLYLAVYTVNPAMSRGAPQNRAVLGCMSFPISRLLNKAREESGNSYSEEDFGHTEHVVNQAGFFLLDHERGKRRNLPQNKIKTHTYYDDQALSGSTVSLANPYFGQPMVRGPWHSTSAVSSAIPGYSEDFNAMNYTSASSSTNNSADYNGIHRNTLPSITTSEATSENDDIRIGSHRGGDIDYRHLYADHAPQVTRDPGSANDPLVKPSTSVRRAASFTFSPKDSSDKVNKRPIVKEEEKKSSRFGPFSKTFSFIKGKVPTLSTGSLHLPTLEEVVLWRTSFNSLLNHKYGSDLFKRFSVKEFSNENVDFWYECEVFKKMKEGKKETIKKANEIYKEFVETSSPREVNLDSDTRAATKAALENGCKSDTFSLSQSRIEQLMNKDSYRRFLKDRLYLDLLETLEEQENGGKKDKE